MLRALHIKTMKDLGYDTYTKTYEELVGEILDDMYNMREELLKREEQRFRDEIDRLLKPTN